MSPRLPTVSSRKLISALERLGFEHRPLKAISHRRYVHPDGRKVTIPVHKGKEIGRGLLRKILRDMKISLEEFQKLLNR